jgi:hypothetical protein
MRRIVLGLGVWLVIVAGVVACSPGAAGDPAQAVEQYLRAKVASDRDKVKALLCARLEGSLDTEVLSFSGVKAELEGLACKKDDGKETVTCAGEIVAEYTNEKMRFPLTTYAVVQEGGTWKWCGESQ